MKKIYIILPLVIFILTGCENKTEELKTEYIAMKNNLLEENNYTDIENLPLDITTKIDRMDEEQIKYKVILNHPKENMNELKAMVVHNYYNEDLFPSIGVFDEQKELLTSSENNSIELEDTIKTTKNVSKMNLKLKVWIEYKNDEGEKKEIYYRTT